MVEGVVRGRAQHLLPLLSPLAALHCSTQQVLIQSSVQHKVVLLLLLLLLLQGWRGCQHPQLPTACLAPCSLQPH